MGEAFLHRRGCSQRPLGAPGLCGWERAGDGPAHRGEGCRQTPAPHCRTQRCPFLAPIELRRLHTPGPQDRQSPRPQNSRRVCMRLLPAQWPLILQPPTPPPSPSSTVEGLKHSGPQPLCPKDSFRLDDPVKLCVSRHYLPQGLGNATPWRCGHGAGQAAEGVVRAAGRPSGQGGSHFLSFAATGRWLLGPRVSGGGGVGRKLDFTPLATGARPRAFRRREGRTCERTAQLCWTG